MNEFGYSGEMMEEVTKEAGSAEPKAIENSSNGDAAKPKVEKKND